MAQKYEFNFDEFTSAVIRHIDSMRSIMSSGDKRVIKDGSNAKLKESRINAFYRALGLPAVLPRKEEKEDEEENNKDTDPIPSDTPDNYNHGNVHGVSDFHINYAGELNDRQSNHEIPPTDDEMYSVLESNQYSLLGGIARQNDSGQVRTRGQLFPMVVDGRIHVFPHEKRVATAFSSDSDRVSPADKRKSFQQPLIETILDIRMKGTNVVNSSDQSDTSAAFVETNREDLQNLSSYNISALDQVGEEVKDRIESALFVIGEHLSKTVDKIRNIRNETGTELVLKANMVADSNTKTRIRDGEEKHLDIQQINQQYKQSLQDIVLQIFGYDRIDKRNVSGGALASILLNIVNPKEEKKSVSKKETKMTNNIIEDKKKKLKAHFRSLEYLLGTFSGISGADVLVIIYSLFMIEEKYLIALLNDKGKDNLALVKGSDVVKQANGISVETAVEELQKVVTREYENVNTHANVVLHSDDPQVNS